MASADVASDSTIFSGRFRLRVEARVAVEVTVEAFEVKVEAFEVTVEAFEVTVGTKAGMAVGTKAELSGRTKELSRSTTAPGTVSKNTL